MARISAVWLACEVVAHRLFITAICVEESDEEPPCKRPRWPLRRLPVRPVTVRRKGQEEAIGDEELSGVAPARLIRRALPPHLADALLAQLLKESEGWQRSAWFIHGKEQVTPRSTAEYQLAESSELLREAARHVREAVVKERPRCTWVPSLALGNRYDDGRSCVAWHSDFLNALGPRPIIVGLSLGACRKFSLRSNDLVVAMPMPHNSA